ncbi:hypothetical protein CEXT_156271 [Caerostris extrusa]|uniref:Uncharacterized protein n=1 Tax=Caerostris extrusa TaxID=172846 RepID=A0AAV4Y3I9_CAEEX|nr:hypothetical protein CEXT_156271 [Caerostris extrusa]
MCSQKPQSSLVVPEVKARNTCCLPLRKRNFDSFSLLVLGMCDIHGLMCGQDASNLDTPVITEIKRNRDSESRCPSKHHQIAKLLFNLLRLAYCFKL